MRYLLTVVAAIPALILVAAPFYLDDWLWPVFLGLAILFGIAVADAKSKQRAQA